MTVQAGTHDDCYLEWLYTQVTNFHPRHNSDTYWNLLRQLYKTQFVAIVPNDTNRAADGEDLRREWACDRDFHPTEEWLSLPCSFLEMLVGLARRLTFITEETAAFWFWHILDNLGFMDFHDGIKYSRNFVSKRLQVINHRQYDQYGNGGLFPLQRTKNDQRRVEIWYQLSEYLLQAD